MRLVEFVSIIVFTLQIPYNWAASLKAKDRLNKNYFPSQHGPSLFPQSDGYVGDQMRLLHDILSQYDPRIRPVNRPYTPVNITVRMNLYQIVEVEERTQHVALYAWMTQMWYDEILAWDPADYGNVTSVVLPFTQVWIPDTYLYNNLQMEREASERWSHVIVAMSPDDTERAKVTFRYPAMYKFICNMNIAFFPFDHQRCRMQFGSWIFDSKGIDYFPEERDVAKEEFVVTEREEWKLLSFTAERRLEKYSCCPHPFSLLEYSLVVARRPMHYVVNLVLPTLIVSVVSNVGFFTPTTTGGERIEKVNLGLTTLLAYSVLLMMVSDSMPSTSSTVPLIGWYLVGTIVQTSLATIMTTIILMIHKKGNDGKPVPERWRRFFFTWLNRYLRIQPPEKRSGDREYEVNSEDSYSALTKNKSRRSSNVYGRIYFGHNGSTSRRHSLIRAAVEENMANLCAMPQVTVTEPADSRKASEGSIPNGNIAPLVNMYTDEEETRKEDSCEVEWEWLASILDRLCLTASLVFLVIFVVGVIGVGYIAGKYY